MRRNFFAYLVPTVCSYFENKLQITYTMLAAIKTMTANISNAFCIPGCPFHTILEVITCIYYAHYEHACQDEYFKPTKKAASHETAQRVTGSDLSSRAVSSQVLWALESLTAVFGMGTGGTSPSLPPVRVQGGSTTLWGHFRLQASHSAPACFLFGSAPSVSRSRFPLPSHLIGAP